MPGFEVVHGADHDGRKAGGVNAGAGIASAINQIMVTIMANTLACAFSGYATAEGARIALLASGFPLSDVHLESMEDEAGPVEDNFIFDCKETPHSADRGGGVHAETTQRDIYLLSVDADDDYRLARAADIMKMYAPLAGR